MDVALARALERVADGLAAMAAGNPGPYAACWADSADVTLFGAWGPIEKGHHAVTRTFEWVGSRFSDGELVPRYEVVDVSGDLAYTVGLEQGTVRIDDGEARPMTIRVSSGSSWPTVSNCSTTCGTTNIISAVTTPSATTARMVG